MQHFTDALEQQSSIRREHRLEELWGPISGTEEEEGSVELRMALIAKGCQSTDAASGWAWRP